MSLGSGVNNMLPKDPKYNPFMLEMFMRDSGIDKSCFEYYPTKYDNALAYVNNSLWAANTCAEGKSYRNKRKKEVIELSELRNKDLLEKYQNVSDISALRNCMWEYGKKGNQ